MRPSGRVSTEGNGNAFLRAFFVVTLAVSSMVSAQEGVIYFRAADGSDVRSVDPRTGSVNIVAEGTIEGVFADGIAIRLNDGTLKVLSLSGGEATGFDSHNVYVRWSRDGRQIVYHRRGRLYTAASDGSGERLLVESGLMGWWSPVEPSVIYFNRHREEVTVDDIFRIDVVTREETLVLKAHHIPEHGEPFSPDGSKMFVSGCGDGGSCFTYLDLRTGKTWDVVSASLEGASRPVWSPDGQSVLYSLLVGAEGLHVLDVSTGTSRELVAGRSGVASVGGVWSPDGQYVAYHLEESSRTSPRVYLKRVDGDEPPLELAVGRWPQWTLSPGQSTGISQRSWGETKVGTDRTR